MELPAGRGGTMSASLQGTLTPQGLLSAAEAEQKRLEEEQAARAASLSQGAGEAAGAFQQAAQAPMPQLNPMAALIQSLGGNVASIIGETPRYAQNAQADLNAQKDELLAKRAQNLAALKDNYDRQAAAALSAGDLLAEAKLRKSAESVSKAWQAIHDEAAFKQANSLADKNNQADLQRTRETIAGNLKEAGIRASRAGSAQSDSDLKALYAGLPTSTGYQTTVRMLGSHVASSKVNTEEAAKTLAVARSLALERNKADRTPEQYAARIKRFNNMVKQLRGKDKGKWWKQILRQDPTAADTISVDEGMAAAREQFPPWELEMIRGNSKPR
jgi:hypothetical protein